MQGYHTSVLLKETIDALHIKKGKRYIDATLGAGGHSTEIIKSGGIVLGIDADTDALSFVRSRIENNEIEAENLRIVQGNFKDIEKIAREQDFGNVDGILFDLGVSSYQVDTAERGFSFLRDGTLDMRMDQNLQVKARDLVNGLTKKELIELFEKYGEERFARKIAEEIVRKRANKPIETTQELVSAIRKVVPVTFGGVHEATRVFQALRIAVNDEINNLRETLPQALDLIVSGGRLVVISFHSLEDRIVKNFYLEAERKGIVKIVSQKPITAGEGEVAVNKRSRSAKMRVLEKI